MERSLLTSCFLPLIAIAIGCGSAAPATAPATPPSASTSAPNASASASASASAAAADAKPKTTSDDPEEADLLRLANEPWGFRRDHWNTLHIPLVDWKTWKRIRIWGNPTRATYRYGDDHRAVDTTLYTAIEGPNDPETCMAKFMDYATTTAQAYGVQLGDSQLVKMNQIINDKARPMLVRLLDGRIESIIANDDYVGAIAVYQSFPGTCLVRGFAVVATNHRDLAIKVRDRWVSEGAPGLVWEKRVKAAPPLEAR